MSMNHFMHRPVLLFQSNSSHCQVEETPIRSAAFKQIIWEASKSKPGHKAAVLGTGRELPSKEWIMEHR